MTAGMVSCMFLCWGGGCGGGGLPHLIVPFCRPKFINIKLRKIFNQLHNVFEANMCAETQAAILPYVTC